MRKLCTSATLPKKRGLDTVCASAVVSTASFETGVSRASTFRSVMTWVKKSVATWWDGKEDQWTGEWCSGGRRGQICRGKGRTTEGRHFLQIVTMHTI